MHGGGAASNTPSGQLIADRFHNTFTILVIHIPVCRQPIGVRGLWPKKKQGQGKKANKENLRIVLIRTTAPQKAKRLGYHAANPACGCSSACGRREPLAARLVRTPVQTPHATSLSVGTSPEPRARAAGDTSCGTSWPGTGISSRRRRFLPSPRMNLLCPCHKPKNQPPAALPVKRGGCCKGIDPWETGTNSLFSLGRKAQ